MCMSSVQLTMKKTKDGSFYGVGYKKILTDTNGRLLASMRGTKLQINKWVQDKNKEYISSYAPGFHLFLNEKDAIDYNSSDYNIYEVHFKDIVAVGTQKAYPINNVCGAKSTDRICVIARKVKVIKKIGKEL